MFQYAVYGTFNCFVLAMTQYCNRPGLKLNYFQVSNFGHDSYEDARSCVELMLWKTRKDMSNRKMAATNRLHSDWKTIKLEIIVYLHFLLNYVSSQILSVQYFVELNKLLTKTCHVFGYVTFVRHLILPDNLLIRYLLELTKTWVLQQLIDRTW